jgi:hypothetical protein
MKRKSENKKEEGKKRVKNWREKRKIGCFFRALTRMKNNFFIREN